MQIQLKQREIAAALKMFIQSQGINLTGKSVEIEFTSGRKDNGLSAELTIEDSEPQTESGLGTLTESPVTNSSTTEPATDDVVATKSSSLFSK
jgi:hypothetical protein